MIYWKNAAGENKGRKSVTTSGTSWIRVLAINLAILLAIFGLLEIITRATLPEYKNAYFNDDTTWGQPIFRNEHWGHRVNPDLTGATLQREGDEQRVLFIGDSVTFGYGVDNRDAYHEVARQRLVESGCSARIHAVGRYHTNLRQLIESEFRHFILDGFGADLIVYQFNVNDLDASSPPKKSADDRLSWRERFEKIRLSYLNRSAFLKFVQSWSIRAAMRNNPPRLMDSLRYSPYSDPIAYDTAWMEFERDLVELKETLVQRGTRLAILLVPESVQISAESIDNDFNTDTSGITPWPNEKVLEIAHRLDIPAFDTLPALREYRAQNPAVRLYFPNDQNHPNQDGHATIGKAVASHLLEALAICGESPDT